MCNLGVLFLFLAEEKGKVIFSSLVQKILSSFLTTLQNLPLLLLGENAFISPNLSDARGDIFSRLFFGRFGVIWQKLPRSFATLRHVSMNPQPSNTCIWSSMLAWVFIFYILPALYMYDEQKYTPPNWKITFSRLFFSYFGVIWNTLRICFTTLSNGSIDTQSSKEQVRQVRKVTAFF